MCVTCDCLDYFCEVSQLYNENGMQRFFVKGSLYGQRNQDTGLWINVRTENYIYFSTKTYVVGTQRTVSMRGFFEHPKHV